MGGMAEKVRIILVKREMTVSALAAKIGTSLPNISNKLRRKNLSEKELFEIADALNCDFEGIFTMRDTGEKI